MEESADKRLRTLVGIEFPGIVNNVDKMIECFGGMTSMVGQMADKKSKSGSTLKLTLTPDNLFSKPVSGDRISVSGFVVKVKRRRYKDGSPDQISYDILGKVNDLYRFNNLVDYQYLPVVETETGEKQSIYDDIVPKGLENTSWLFQDAPLYLPPIFFSRFDVPQRYCYRRKPGGEEAKVVNKAISRFRAERNLPSIVVKYEDPLPDFNQEEPRDQYKHFYKTYYCPKLFEAVKKFFEERPVWCRCALESKLKQLDFEVRTLKMILPRIAYYFTTGPWFKAWAKKGYDPRLDTKARSYQVLDFRLPISLATKMNVDAKRSYKKREAPFRTPVTQIMSKSAIDEIVGTPIKPVEERETTHGAFEFHPGEFPTQRNTLYQYCDIFIPEVEEILSSPVAPDHMCSSDDGWLPVGTNDRVRKILVNYLMLVVKKASQEEKEAPSTSGSGKTDDDDYDDEASHTDDDSTEDMDYEDDDVESDQEGQSVDMT